MVEEIIWRKDYTPEKSSSWSSNGRYEYVNKKYYKKCYFKINGVEKETRHKYLYEETNDKIDHYDYSYTDTKEEKTGDYIDNHSYTYFLFKDWNWNNRHSYEYKYNKYKRNVIVLDNGKRIYGDWEYDGYEYKYE